MTQLPRWAGVAILLAIAVSFAANHVSARLAFDDGASVLLGLTVRSICTALFVFVLLRAQRVPIVLPPGLPARGAAIGVLLALQSFFLYSAVARLPVALALLVFNSFPILLSLISWASGGERPVPRAMLAMPIALTGLVLALDVIGALGSPKATAASFWPGIAFGIGAALTMAAMLLLTIRWLSGVDGRMRTLMTMSVAAVLLLVAGLATDGLAFPQSARGWLGLALLTLFYGAAFTSLFVVLPHVGVVSNAAVLNIEPIVALGLAWVVLGQTIGPLQLLGAFIVVGAIILLSTARR